MSWRHQQTGVREFRHTTIALLHGSCPLEGWGIRVATSSGVTRKDQHETRHHRRHWADRIETRDDAAVAASPDTGVNTVTGEGVAEALQGASVVVDVSNSPSFEDTAVMEFFTTSTRNLPQVRGSSRCEALRRAVRGGNRAPTGESLPPSEERSGNADQGWRDPVLDVHATQFFSSSSASPMKPLTERRSVPPVLIQPMAADDVAKAVGRIAVGAPLNGTVEVAVLNSSVSMS